MNILDIQNRAAELGNRTAEGSITPQDVANLHIDTLRYIARTEARLASIGIRKVYATADQMRADQTPTDTQGGALKYGQLACVYAGGDAATEIFAYQGTAGQWLSVGKIGQPADLSALEGSLANMQSEIASIQALLGDNASQAIDTLAEVFTLLEDYQQGVSLATRLLEMDDDIAMAQSTANRAVALAEDFKAPIQAITVNGETVPPTSDGVVNIEAGRGSVKAVSLNGVEQPVIDGRVHLNIDLPNYSSDIEALQSRVREMNSDSYASQIDADVDDEGKLTITLKNQKGLGISETEVNLPAGGGGTGDEAENATRVQLSASLDKSAVKVGDAVTLTYRYRHEYKGGDRVGESTGQQATITITATRGQLEVLNVALPNVAEGEHTFDLTPYIGAGATAVYVRAVVDKVDGSGTQSRQAFAQVSAYQLHLTSNYELTAQPIDSGVALPFAVSGSGNKEVLLLLNGVQVDSRTVTRSGTTNGVFNLVASAFRDGQNSVQMVARLTDGGTVVSSESIYFGINKGNASPCVAIGLVREDGRVWQSDAHLSPTLFAKQYEEYSLQWAVYDANLPTSEVIIRQGDRIKQSTTAGRTTQTFTDRPTLSGESQLTFTAGESVWSVGLDVSASEIDVSASDVGLTLELLAVGRSNNETHPSEWSYKDVRSVLQGFDFSSNGWIDGALLLVNESQAEIGFAPFRTDATRSGCTVEIEFQVANIIDRTASIISIGESISITPQQASIRTNNGSTASTKFGENEWYKVAFVVRSKEDGRRLEVFVNGERAGVTAYSASDTLLDEGVIRMNSLSADLRVRSVRAYNRALSDDEVLNNYIADRTNVSEITTLWKQNDVLNEDGSVSAEKLRAMGKNVMYIVGDLDLVVATNNTKFEVPVDVYFYSSYGKEYDFVLKGGGLRIQGTSSTTYPRKNYRVYFDRKKKYNTTLTVGGVPQEELKYRFRPDAKPVGLFTFKADFAESSSTHNTGIARLINDTWLKLGWLTPPQKNDASVRIGVDGFPMDVFGGATLENASYIGKYNFNNDKGKQPEVFGFAGDNCMCLEFRNNTHDLVNFLSDDLSAFGSALEFRYPEDLEWEDASESQKGAVQRLWQWVLSCRNNPSKFASEVREYFNINSLLGWYVATEYFMMVDQRAKNMMMATWDGQKWFFIPYDNDTCLGLNNKGEIAYDYLIDENTYDPALSNHAYAGHQSVLWDLVRRGLARELANTAISLRAMMSQSTVFQYLNKEQAEYWSKRIYNKDGEYKYLATAEATGGQYLDLLQGSRTSHRSWLISNRFALLDAKYLAGEYRKNAINLYLANDFKRDPRRFTLKATEPYYFAHGMTAREPEESGLRATSAGETVTMTYAKQEWRINDPQLIYGADRMGEIDFGGIVDVVTGGLNFSPARRLKRLNLEAANGRGNDGISELTFTACTALEWLSLKDVRGNGLRTLDLTANKRLQYLDASGTRFATIDLANGGAIRTLKLPASLTSLKLRNLPNLTMDGLTFENTDNITSLWLEGCPHIDWKALMRMLPNLTRVRIVGINERGSSSTLLALITKAMGGLDAWGGAVQTCSLVGTYQLTTYLPDEDYARYKAYFPELELRQPEYSTYTLYQGVADTRCWHNHDNGTGYNPLLIAQTVPYTPSGHLATILGKIHRYLGKHGSQGTQHIVQMDDNDSSKYYDGTTAVTTGAEGDMWVRIPQFWYKGVTDVLGEKHHVCLASTKPTTPASTTVLTVADRIEGRGDAWIDTSASSLSGAIKRVSESGVFAIAKFRVAGFGRVRFQTIAVSSNVNKTEKTPNIGALFLDADNRIVGRQTVNDTIASSGQYLIADIPDGAEYIYFTHAMPDALADVRVILGQKDTPIEDFEPEWVENKAFLMAAFSVLKDDAGLGVRSVSNLASATRPSDAWGGSIPHQSFVDELNKRYWSNILYDQWKIYNMLSTMKYGDMRVLNIVGTASFPHGNHAYRNWIVGGSLTRGMRDTVRHNERVGYMLSDTYGQISFTPNQDYHNNLLGVESMQVYGWHTQISMPKLVFPDARRTVGNWLAARILMVDGITRTLPTGNYYGYGALDGTLSEYATHIWGGKYCDFFPVGTQGGSTSTFLGWRCSNGSSLWRIDNWGDLNAWCGINAFLDHSSSLFSLNGHMHAHLRRIIAVWKPEFKIVEETDVERYKQLPQLI